METKSVEQNGGARVCTESFSLAKFVTVEHLVITLIL